MSGFGKIRNYLMQQHTVWVICGVILLLFDIFLLVSFFSYFFSGMSDQSAIEHVSLSETGISAETEIRGQAGMLGGRMSQFLIDRCFGVPALLLIPLLGITALRITGFYRFNVTKCFLKYTIPMLWASVLLSKVPGLWTAGLLHFHVGGIFGENAANWIIKYIGGIGLALLLLTVFILYMVAVRKEKSIKVIHQVLGPHQPKHAGKKDEPDVNDDGTPEPEDEEDVDEEPEDG